MPNRWEIMYYEFEGSMLEAALVIGTAFGFLLGTLGRRLVR